MINSHYDWQFKNANDASSEAEELASALSVEPLIAQILINRGYQSVASATAFLHPDLSQLADPFLMHDMQVGTERIQAAIMAGEKITIYGDYDADGVTSTAILYDTLLQLGAEVDYFIPNRFVDGYGPNAAAFERLIKAGTQLIVTVDNGVSGHDAIARANELGVEVVVTDHHELPEVLPDAAAIIHPRHPQGQYPFGGLSGAGVAFKVATALLEEIPQELLDLAAIGTVADLVPIVGENRVLVTTGLKLLAATERPGLQALMAGAGIKPETLDEQSIGFGIAPRLNALGRLDDAAPAVELLTTLDPDQAQSLADLTESQNKYRQKLVADISKEALQQAEDEAHSGHPTALIVGENWHEGVLGIVASKVVEATGKPAVVLSRSKDGMTAKGSGRSVAGFNLFEAFDDQRDLLVAFGGHAAAVGMTAKAIELDALQRAFDAAAAKQQLADQPKPTLPIAARLSAGEVTQKLYQQLHELAPFGTDNPVPLFAFSPASVNDVKAIGAAGNHLKFKVVDGAHSVDAIDFGDGAFATELAAAPTQVSLVAQLGVNVWQGRTTMQLMVKDIALTGLVFEDQRTQTLRQSLFTQTGVYAFFNPKLYDQLQPQLPAGATSWLLADADRVPLIKTPVLYLVDCPTTLVDLESALTHIRAQKIVAYFYTKQSHYLLGVPDRQQYANLFRFVKTHHDVDVSHRLAELAKYLQLDRDQLVFMIQNFIELHFVTVTNGLMNATVAPDNQPIESAPSYVTRQQQIKTEKQLLYSETPALRELVLSYVAEE